jgi:hypothetical protein
MVTDDRSGRRRNVSVIGVTGEKRGDGGTVLG